MIKKVSIGIIGAMQPEVESLIGLLKKPKMKNIGGQVFYYGTLDRKSVAIVKCGIGKVYAAMTAENLILNFAPKLIINTGVAGSLRSDLRQGDIVVASELCQHDMDTSPLGDPKGFISGADRIYFSADERARRLLAVVKNGDYAVHFGAIATGDRFVSTEEQKAAIVRDFSASACEMEGGAIAQVAFTNKIPFCVIRAISDGADEDARLSYDRFLPIAASRSASLTRELIKKY